MMLMEAKFDFPVKVKVPAYSLFGGGAWLQMTGALYGNSLL